MANFHHRTIKKFGLSGVINDESSSPRLKIEYVRLLVSEMRATGYVPRLDIEPDFTIDYNRIKNCFEFEVSVYGIYIGKRKSEWIVGVDGHKAISMEKSKLKGSSQQRAQTSKQN
jgi:hypothetical protein